MTRMRVMEHVSVWFHNTMSTLAELRSSGPWEVILHAHTATEAKQLSHE